MKVEHEGELPVITGTPAELAKVASAVLVAIRSEEAVVFLGGRALLGVRCREQVQVTPEWHRTWTEETGGSDG